MKTTTAADRSTTTTSTSRWEARLVDAGRTIAVRDRGGNWIASVEWIDSFEQTAANARLLAEAPRLLDLVVRAAAYVPVDLQDEMRDAIANAVQDDVN